MYVGTPKLVCSLGYGCAQPFRSAAVLPAQRGVAWRVRSADIIGRGVSVAALRTIIDRLAVAISWPFWRGETGAAWEFHGSDGSAGAPWPSIHLCRCGLAFTVCLGVVTPVASLVALHGATRCPMVQRRDSETSASRFCRDTQRT